MPTSIAKIKMSIDTNVGEYVEQWGPSCIAEESVKLYNLLKNLLVS